jgi:hypothetical protein
MKRSKARMATGSWIQAVDDANQVHHFYLLEINLVDPSSSGNHTRSVLAMGLRDEGLSTIYDEGESSLGRLSAHVLTVSGDASILAWTGESGRLQQLPAHTYHRIQ